MESNSLITKLNVISPDGSSLFNPCQYEIPLYQRAFAWREKQISQLLEDINDVEEGRSYYIGTLIVSRKGDTFEVVDGQQRLTCLFLLLNALGLQPKGNLRYACRSKSNYTVEHITELFGDQTDLLDRTMFADSMIIGSVIISEELKKYNKDVLKDKLKNVVIYRIEVPEHTDLNRYFETMNVRGEQLEQHDILKATLMEKSQVDYGMFSKIWDACSDMTGYVQMHFSNDNNLRDNLFGPKWGSSPSISWSSVSDNANKEIPGIEQIIDGSFEPPKDEIITENDDRIRFESIIEFPYFLLHCLKIYVSVNNITSNDGKDLVPSMMNDKKLVDTFDRVIRDGRKDGKALDDSEFAKGFIECMLKTRFLFDKYIIKREFKNEEDKDGSWSLKNLLVSGEGKKRRPYFADTSFYVAKNYERNVEKTKREKNLGNLMLQSAFRVSYTSPKLMHWITVLLKFLYLDEDNNRYKLFGKANDLAVETVKKEFFDKCKENSYMLGFGTHHMVFNYLDFLLWKDEGYNKELNGESFVFEFRNSIEHWYPRHPSSEMFEKWEDGVDTFGNLCLLQRDVNSKFSNLEPRSKKESYKPRIDKGSLKLRLMSNLTKSGIEWKDKDCNEHEKQMIGILKNALEEYQKRIENQNTICE